MRNWRGGRQGPSLPQSRVQFKVRLKVRRSYVRDLSSEMPLWSVASRETGTSSGKEGLPFSFSKKDVLCHKLSINVTPKNVPVFQISGRCAKDSPRCTPHSACSRNNGFRVPAESPSAPDLQRCRQCRDRTQGPIGISRDIAGCGSYCCRIALQPRITAVQGEDRLHGLVPSFTRRIVPDSQRTNHYSRTR